MDKNILEDLISKGNSLRVISEITKKSLTTIRYWVKKHNLNSNYKNFKESGVKVFLDQKRCNECGIVKKISEFHKKKDRKNGNSICKICFSKYCIKRWILRKIESIKYMGSKCRDCGIEYPKYPYVIFDFHHIDPNQKEFVWAKLKLKSDEKIRKELDKCELLCSNCHRKRHHNMVVPRGIEPLCTD